MDKKWLLAAGGIGILAGAAAGYVVFQKSREVIYVAATPIETPTPAPTPKEVTMIFVGDIMLSRQVGDKIAASGDWGYPFLRIAEFLRSADLAIANLENPVSTRGTRVGSIYSFRADPRTLEGLRYAGIDIVSLANNHIWDYARQAFLDTMAHLSEYGIDFMGAGMNFAEAHRGVTKTVNGTAITFFGYTNLISKQAAATAVGAGISYLDKVQVVKDIQLAKSRGEFVVVSYHIGDEYQLQHNATQELVYKEAIDAGADLVIGHHPHVVQEVEQYKEAWIAYSLGNFIFDQYFSKETLEGLALKVTLAAGKISKVEKIPIGISAQSQAYLK